MIYVILGPTACGKTTLANRLSDHLGNASLINADAFQVYKDLDIGTAKLSKDSKYYSRYLLFDYLSPEVSFNIKDYQDEFRKVLDINKDMIVVGGSGLYVRSALYDYSFIEEENNSNHDELNNEELYDLLVKLDPETAKTLHPNNRRRVERAVSIAEAGNKKSDILNSQTHKPIYPIDKLMFIFINPDRKELYEKINKRVDKMFDDGLVDECKKLREKYHLSQTAKQAIGYKEVFDYLDGKMSLEDTKELIKKRTRNYAKRQVTFFKHQFDCVTFASTDEAWEYLINER